MARGGSAKYADPFFILRDCRDLMQRRLSDIARQAGVGHFVAGDRLDELALAAGGVAVGQQGELDGGVVVRGVGIDRGAHRRQRRSHAPLHRQHQSRGAAQPRTTVMNSRFIQTSTSCRRRRFCRLRLRCKDDGSRMPRGSGDHQRIG